MALHRVRDAHSAGVYVPVNSGVADRLGPTGLCRPIRETAGRSPLQGSVSPNREPPPSIVRPRQTMNIGKVHRLDGMSELLAIFRL